MRSFLYNLLILLAVSPFYGNAEDFPFLKKPHAINQSHIYLGDLFKSISDKKASLIIDVAPSLGQSRKYNEKDLSIIALQYQINWQPQKEDVIILTRAARIIGSKALKQLVRQKLSQKLGTQYVSIELKDPKFKLYLSTHSADKPRLLNFHYDPQTKDFKASFTIGTKEEFQGPYAFEGKVIDTIAIPVLNRPMQPGDLIEEGDIDFIDTHINQLRRDTYVREEDLIGKTPHAMLRPYISIQKRQIHFPLLVKKNALITVVYTKENIHITAKGKALEEGAMGDIIQIMNLTSKKIIQGELIAPKKARVNLVE